MKRVIKLVVVGLLFAMWAGSALADESRFVFSDKTVMDKSTGLIWIRDANQEKQRSVQGNYNPTLGKRNWKGAFELINDLNRSKYAGYNDWRLPVKKELETLTAYAKGLGYDNSDRGGPNKLFNKMGFYEVQSDYYWSSSSEAGYNSKAGVVYMTNGGSSYKDKEDSAYVWPVRK